MLSAVAVASDVTACRHCLDFRLQRLDMCMSAALPGGIAQGMSGSPILQDGKLIGAVTHVLPNDPTRGYGLIPAEAQTAENAA